MQQMVERFSPLETSNRTNKASLVTLLLDGEYALRMLGLAALVWLPVCGRKRQLLGLPVMVALYAGAAFLASGFVSPRYSLHFVPLMVTALAVVVVGLPLRSVYRLTLLMLICLVCLGPIKTANQLGMTQGGASSLEPLIRRVGTAVQPADTLIYCGRADDSDRLYISALAFYANTKKPWVRLRKPGDIAEMAAVGAISFPLRGLCASTLVEHLFPLLDGVEIIENSGDYLHWRARGLRQ